MKTFRFNYNGERFEVIDSKIKESIKIPGSQEAIDQLYPKDVEANSASLIELRTKLNYDYNLEIGRAHV